MSSYKMPQPRLGDEVLWYPHADPANKPMIMKVLEVGNNGIEGSCFRMYSSTLMPVHGVHHMDDPIHREVPRPTCSIEGGGWTFKPWEVRGPENAQPEPAKAQPEPLVPDTADDVEVLHLRYNKKFPPSVIAQRMGGAWTTKTVRAVLDRYGDQQALDLLRQKMPKETAAVHKDNELALSN